MNFLRRAYRRILRALRKPDFTFDKPLTPGQRTQAKRDLNATWGVYKRFGCVRKITWPIGCTNSGKKIMAGRYFIGPSRHTGVQPPGLKRIPGKTVIQAYNKLKKRVGI